jgi:ribulose-phosphate 3-epimerase
MQIIPAINCQDFNCVKEKIQKAAEIGVKRAQIDIADGVFAPHKTWNNPREISNFKSQTPDLNLEIHLMVENPLDVINDWIEAGVNRIIIHCEAIENSKFKNQKSKLNLKNCEIGIAIKPKTSIEKLIPYFAIINDGKKFVQLLAVEPGLSGQKFQPQILDKIKFLKKNFPDVIIEIDGGINLETAKLCKQAGADILVAGSYIFGGSDPLAAYEKLAAV